MNVCISDLKKDKWSVLFIPEVLNLLQIAFFNIEATHFFAFVSFHFHNNSSFHHSDKKGYRVEEICK